MGQFEWISLKFMPSLVLYVGTDTNGYLSGRATLTDYQCDFPDGLTLELELEKDVQTIRCKIICITTDNT